MVVFQVNDTKMRLEIDTAVSNITAQTNKLDPVILDEAAITEIDKISSLRLGVEQNLNQGKLIYSADIACANVNPFCD